jgi:hypothetical protein
MNEMVGVEAVGRARKQTAVEFLQLVVGGRIGEAFQKHVDLKGKHHNVTFPAGFPALMKAMIENQAQFPNKQFEVKNISRGNRSGGRAFSPPHPTWRAKSGCCPLVPIP